MGIYIHRRYLFIVISIASVPSSLYSRSFLIDPKLVKCLIFIYIFFLFLLFFLISILTHDDKKCVRIKPWRNLETIWEEEEECASDIKRKRLETAAVWLHTHFINWWAGCSWLSRGDIILYTPSPSPLLHPPYWKREKAFHDHMYPSNNSVLSLSLYV